MSEENVDSEISMYEFFARDSALEFILDSDDEEFIWVHGHMHQKDIIQTAGGPIVVNARGYIGYGADEYSFMRLELPVL